MNKADFYPGECYCCLQKTDVRLHENIYMSGSEGTTLCGNCEKAVRQMITSIRRIWLHEELTARIRAVKGDK